MFWKLDRDGGHSALFAKYGIIVTSADITPERTNSTQNEFKLLGEIADGSQSIQADAENNLNFPKLYF